MDTVLAAIGAYKYFFLVIAAIIEGPVVSLVSGALLRTGDLSLTATAVALMTGDLIGDTIWYSVGYLGGDRFVRRFGKYVSTTPEEIATVKRVFHRYHEGILLFSKTTTGFGFALATLIVAGMTRIPFGKYMALNAIGQIAWTFMLLGIGFYLGDFYLTAGSILSKMGLVAAGAMLVFVFFRFKKYVRNQLSKS